MASGAEHEPGPTASKRRGLGPAAMPEEPSSGSTPRGRRRGRSVARAAGCGALMQNPAPARPAETTRMSSCCFFFSCGCVCRLLCLGSKWRQGKGPCRMVSGHHQEGPRAGLEVGRLAPPARAMLKVMLFCCFVKLHFKLLQTVTVFKDSSKTL